MTSPKQDAEDPSVPFPVNVEVLLSPGPKVRPENLPYPILLKISVPRGKVPKKPSLYIQGIVTDSTGYNNDITARARKSEAKGPEVSWHTVININMRSMSGECRVDLELQFCGEASSEFDTKPITVKHVVKFTVDNHASPSKLSDEKWMAYEKFPLRCLCEEEHERFAKYM